MCSMCERVEGIGLGLCQKHLNEHHKKYRARDLEDVKNLLVVKINKKNMNYWRIYYKSKLENDNEQYMRLDFGASNGFNYWNKRAREFETDFYTNHPRFMIEDLGEYLFDDKERFTYEVLD